MSRSVRCKESRVRISRDFDGDPSRSSIQLRSGVWSRCEMHCRFPTHIGSTTASPEDSMTRRAGILYLFDSSTSSGLPFGPECTIGAQDSIAHPIMSVARRTESVRSRSECGQRQMLWPHRFSLSPANNERVGLVTLGTRRTSQQPKKHADFVRPSLASGLRQSQLPDPTPGTNIRIPAAW